jgi:hypothetical protein
MVDVFCTCKSHCTTYNHDTKAYDGGQVINKSTAYRHRMDDNRSVTLDRFARHVASSILNETPGLGIIRPSNGVPIFSPLDATALPGEVMTLEGEIRDRISWMATSTHLVFAIDPVPDLDFENPLNSSQFIPNNGTHLLNPSNPINIPFIENESRLYEILGNLRTGTLPIDQEVLEDLVDMVTIGLGRMMEHKGSEWERQRGRTRAIARGYDVVNTGMFQEIMSTHERN